MAASWTVGEALVPTRGRPSRRASSAISSRSLTSDNARGGPMSENPKTAWRRPSAVAGSGRDQSDSQVVTVRSPTPIRSASSRCVNRNRPRCLFSSSPVITHGGYPRRYPRGASLLNFSNGAFSAHSLQWVEAAATDRLPSLPRPGPPSRGARAAVSDTALTEVIGRPRRSLMCAKAHAVQLVYVRCN